MKIRSQYGAPLTLTLIRFLSLDFSVPTQTVDLEFIFCQVNANR